MSALDLHFISLYRIGGQEWPQLPGLLALNPPRKTARGRDQDRLLVYLTLAGNMMYSTSEYTSLTSQAAQLFYSTGGSLTFALKTAVEWLNTTLVERNMKTTGKGQYCLGALMLAALRGNSMYIVQSGPTHAYWLGGSETRHYNDPALAGKGLGLSQTARMYFAQATLSPGDRMLFCAALPPNWDKALTEERGAASLEATRRRLLAVTDTNISAVLFRTSEGSGVMNVLRPSKELPAEPAQPAAARPTAQPAIQPASAIPAPGGLPAAVPPSNVPAATPQAETQSSVASRQFTVASRPAPQASPVTQPPTPAPVNPPTPLPDLTDYSPGRRSAASRRRAVEKEYSPEPKALLTPERREKAQKGFRAAARFLAKTLQGGRMLNQKISAGLEKMLPHLLPGSENESPMNLPGSWLGFISVVVPILVVTVAVMVYNQFGIPNQYDVNLQRARETAAQTLQQQNPIEQRKGWTDTLAWLDTAEQFQSTPDSEALRKQAQDALDALNRTQRVDYKLAFSNTSTLPTHVTHMDASDIDLYLLDDVRGEVTRGVLNGQVYERDASFTCTPGNYAGVQVGALVDIIALPRSNPTGATLLGIDASGNVLYCAPGEAPKAITLQMPDVGWKQITSVAFDANNLYVLDAPGRAVWVYFGGPDIELTGKLPYFFFESQIPNALDQAIGIAVNGDDLYLLHSDGHLTTCTLSRIDVSPTRCMDAAIFIDTRPGYESGATLSDGIFSQIAFSSPPNPSVALLQSHTQSVFRFSARALELQNQIQAFAGKKSPLPEGMPITAMAYSPNKALFIFVGGQVYFAANVP